MLADVIGKPIRIQGFEVILLPDMIGTVPVTEQHEYVETARASHTCASIHMREADIESVRRLYPTTPVYGLWQVLVHSELVNPADALQVVPVNEMDGYYVHADLGRILYSGNYDAGFFAADTDFRLNNARCIQAQFSALRLPEQEAMLAREILGKRRKVLKTIAGKIGVGVVLMIAIAAALDSGLQFWSEQGYDTIVAQDKKLAGMQKNLAALAKNRLIKTPDQSAAVHRLGVIIHDLEDIKFEKSIAFHAKQVELTAVSDTNPQEIYEFVKTHIQSDGRWHITLDLY